MNLTRLVLAGAPVLLLCGCGTIGSAVMMSYYERPKDPPADYEPPNYVYGGVKVDAKAIQVGLSGDAGLSGPIYAVLFLADLPLSALFDTLSLPITVPATKREADSRRRTLEMNRAKFDDERNQVIVEPGAPAPDDTPRLTQSCHPATHSGRGSSQP